MDFYVYILANRHKRLYVGVTRDLRRRLAQHLEGTSPHFTRRYNITHLVHVETTGDVRAAIGREKQIKGWMRKKKVALIERDNPTWRDLVTGRPIAPSE